MPKRWEIHEDSLGFPLLARIIDKGIIRWVEDGDFIAFRNMTHALFMFLLPLLKADKHFIEQYTKLKGEYESGKIKEEKFYFRLFELITTFLALRGALWKILIHYRESQRVDNEDSELNYLIDYLKKVREGDAYSEI